MWSEASFLRLKRTFQQYWKTWRNIKFNRSAFLRCSYCLVSIYIKASGEAISTNEEGTQKFTSLGKQWIKKADPTSDFCFWWQWSLLEVQALWNLLLRGGIPHSPGLRGQRTNMDSRFKCWQRFNCQYFYWDSCCSLRVLLTKFPKFWVVCPNPVFPVSPFLVTWFRNVTLSTNAHKVLRQKCLQ